MSFEVDRTRFLEEPTRLRIAELCRDEALSLAEIAAELGRQPGSLSQHRTMLDWEALVAGEPRASDGRGQAKTYRLNNDWEEALVEARRRRRPSWPDARQELLLVPLADVPAACAAIAEGIADVDWGAEVRGGMSGLVLAPALGGGSTVRVIERLREIAPRVVPLQLGDVMGPGELREWSREAAGLSTKELPPAQ
jgi:DNA-binding transcriptional ArsR family regulator